MANIEEVETCTLCGHERREGEWFFQDLCNRCSTYIHDPPYQASQYHSVRMSYVELLVAIRNKAVEDGALDEFEAFWLRGPEMRQVWVLLTETLFGDKPSSFRYSTK